MLRNRNVCDARLVFCSDVPGRPPGAVLLGRQEFSWVAGFFWRPFYFGITSGLLPRIHVPYGSHFLKSAFEAGDLFFLFFFEVPGYGLSQPFVEEGFRLIAELSGGTGDVGEGMLDVTFTFGAVDWFGGEA
jgi:hypothetical protein